MNFKKITDTIQIYIYIFTKNAWVKSLKDKKAKAVPHGFIEIVNIFKHKPNKL